MNNFKVIEAKAYTREEALAQANFKTTIKGADCTQAWKNAGKPITQAALKDFMANQLNDKTRFTEGVGCYIVVEAGSPDTRERPYTYNNVVNEKGKRHYVSTIQIIDRDTNKILAEVVGSKTDAEKAAKELYTEHDFRGNLAGKMIHTVDEGEPLAFTMDYTPSKSAKLGTYLLFGVEA